jgi:hypothetical protein
MAWLSVSCALVFLLALSPCCCVALLCSVIYPLAPRRELPRQLHFCSIKKASPCANRSVIYVLIEINLYRGNPKVLLNADFMYLIITFTFAAAQIGRPHKLQRS